MQTDSNTPSFANNISLSKTDLKGIIEYANDTFIKASEFSRAEIMGKPHNIIRHSDMPKVAFKLMWDTIQNGKTFYAIVKNKTKTDNFYWVLARVEPKTDADGNIVAYFSQRKALPNPDIIQKIEPYYQILREIETDNKLEVSEKYFNGLLEDMGVDYEKFILQMLDFTPQQLTDYFIDAKTFNQIAVHPKLKTKPTPNHNETKVDPSQIIMSKTDLKGIIQYANDYFVKICEYTTDELIGTNHNIIRHPEMPKVLFKLMWDTLKSGEGIFAIVKNMTKSGGFYWVLARVEPVVDQDDNIISYVSYRKAAPPKAVERIESYYKILLNIEQKKNLETSETYFINFLHDHQLNYEQFLLKILGTDQLSLFQYFEGLIRTKPVVQSEPQSIEKQETPVVVTKSVRISLDPTKFIISKINPKGYIESCNDYFYEISGFKEADLIGKMFNIIRHPDNPKTIFKLLWDQLLLGKSFNVVTKKITADGNYYWVMNHIQPIKNQQNEILGYQFLGKAIPKDAEDRFQAFYDELKKIESTKGENYAYNFVINMLAEKKQTFDDWLIQTLQVKKEEILKYFSELGIDILKTSDEKKSLFKRWFG